MARIGVISDTHGLLRPEAVALLQGSDHIIHAGDIGNADILARLSALAPLTAVRGNNDHGPWADRLADTELVELSGALVYVIHDLSLLGIDPSGAGVQVVISGHSHKPSMAHRGGVLYLNPGSAGPRRFRLPIALAQLDVVSGKASARIVELDAGPAS
jgi:uncharacterized protein